MSAPASPQPRRSWFRYSLRTLFIILTVMCMLGGWWLNKAMRQRAAVQRFYELTGRNRSITTMGYRYRGEDKYYKPIVPAWLHPLRDLLGEEAFGEVTGVQLISTRATDDDLRYLADVPSVERVSLNSTRITDEGLAHLRACHKLRFVALNKTAITDRGLETLAALKDLESLSLTDAGLRHLEQLPKLKEIWLRNTSITDAGYRRLQAAFPQCEIQASVPAYLHKRQLEYTGRPSRR